MSNRRWAAAGSAAALLMLTGCGFVAHNEAAPKPAKTTAQPGSSSDPIVTDANGDTCVMSALSTDSYCPGSVPSLPDTTEPAIPVEAGSWSFHGTGNWNSPPFTLSCSQPVLTVTFSYKNNGDSFGPSNFIAYVNSSDDTEPVADDIAYHGGTTTTIYPGAFGGGSPNYHLEVQADGSWKFKITEEC